MYYNLIILVSQAEHSVEDPSQEHTSTNGVITVFTVFRLLTDFVCLYTYEF
jgi:hypothetical protein